MSGPAARPGPSPFEARRRGERLRVTDMDECSLLQRTRHCERSEAIQTVSAEGLWIVSLRSQ